MRFSHFLLPFPLLALIGAQLVMKTHIYIDTLSAYSTLGACVKSRMSAIVRAQASGCGDNMQLTSFACFCLTSSTQFNSIISTDIMSQCVMQTANAMMPRRAKRTASMVRETPRQVANALQVFNMYCAMSTDLAQFQQQPVTVILTQPPDSTPNFSGRGRRGKQKVDGTVIAATIISSIILLMVIVGGILWILYRRRKHLALVPDPKRDSTSASTFEIGDDAAVAEKDTFGAEKGEMVGDHQQRSELERTEIRVQRVYELESSPVELAAGEYERQVRRGPGNGKEGWI